MRGWMRVLVVAAMSCFGLAACVIGPKQEDPAGAPEPTDDETGDGAFTPEDSAADTTVNPPPADTGSALDVGSIPSVDAPAGADSSSASDTRPSDAAASDTSVSDASAGDGASDASPDAVTDVSTDVSTDTSTDTGSDVSSDAGEDALGGG